MSASTRNVTFGVIATALVAASPAWGQGAPKLEGTISYAGAHVSGRDSSQSYDVGIMLDGSMALSDRLAVLGEVSWGRARANDLDFERTRAAYNVTTFGGGARYTMPGQRLTPFAQVVLGLSRDTFDPRECFLFAECLGLAYTTNSFMLQPGGGAVWRVGEHWGVAGQVDYRRVLTGKLEVDGEEGFNAFRFSVGIRFASAP